MSVRTPPGLVKAITAPPFVGLTGGIGAGKSEALAALARLGAATLSTDAVVHGLYEDPEVREAVVARWGPEMAPGGRVDRSEVARVAFATDEDRAWLERLLWPRVGQKVAEWRATATGKALKSWHHPVRVSFLPNSSVLVVFEPNNTGGTATPSYTSGRV